MDKPKFNPKVHTLSYFEELQEKLGTQMPIADRLGISRFVLARWIKKAKEIAKERKSNEIPTLNQLYEYIKKQPDHIEYKWFMKHKNAPKKHYNAAMKKILDLAREYQSTL